ncbi:DUF3800 domain-containing protein [Nocardioides alkalitolerans]|uniref:DUF3800 domain-containing protein n=1 Tax=Nocardioides alkalitolerans TaxID=281714 RepID=UPI00048AF96B|nr:DUF3800 domain-containing protein [Nocardioides alkalitolerans]
MGEMTRMIYVDDSGVEDRGWIVYGWVEVSPEGWRRGLRAWLDLRKRLFTDYVIHVSTELHATKFLQGRGEITAAPPVRFANPDGTIRWKDLGREVGELCLEVIRDCPEIRVGAVHRHTAARGTAYNDEKHDVYAALVSRFDHELRASDAYGFITMDGQDLRYRDAHRSLKLDDRHVIEDPAYHDSRMSQWTQMADLVAYVAYMNLNQHAGNQFAWNWFNHYLGISGTLDQI